MSSFARICSQEYSQCASLVANGLILPREFGAGKKEHYFPTGPGKMAKRRSTPHSARMGARMGARRGQEHA